MRRIAAWFRRQDESFQDEIRTHVEMETAENLERGLPSEEARRAAERTFGNVSVLRELIREARSTYWLDTLVQDGRYGLRLLMRTPWLSALIITTLVFGISLSSSVFTLLDAELFRAKVDSDPAKFLRVIAAYSFNESSPGEPGTVPLDDYLAYREGVAPYADLAAWNRVPATLDDDPAVLGALLVTSNFFAVYGLERAALGRLFRPDECSTPGGAPVAVLSEEVWRNRFSSDPGIIGRVIRLNWQALTVVGVAPARFSGRNSRDTHAWIPYTMQANLRANRRLQRAGPPDLFRESGTPWLQVVGRLRASDRSQVGAALQLIAGRQDQLYPGRKRRFSSQTALC